ncbi:MAG: AAA family ATPase [Candidatus Acidiferrales bacterium]
MVLDFYKLTEQPFGVTPDSRFLYLGPKHREALASLVYGTESGRGFLALIAKPGMGKTSLLYHYLSYLRDKARTAFVFRTDCDSREFIRHVLLDLGVDVAGMDLPGMHDTLNRLLTEEMRLGRRFVLVIDEAQNLDEKVLESVRLLSNFETPWMKLMQIVLAGQPQLADHLASSSMAQLRQRVSMVIKLDPFTHDEVNAYIDHRLWVAGCSKPEIFSANARKLIAEHSEGIPRNINNLCFNALSLGCALRKKTIDRDIVLEVIADLDLEPLREQKPAAKKPADVSPQPKSVFISETKKRSIFSRWIPSIAITSALLIGLSWFAVHAERRSPEKVQPSAKAAFAPAAPAPVLAPVTAQAPSSANPVVPDEKEAASIQPEPGSEDVRVLPGQTLYQISVNKLGRYDDQVLEKLRGLNPSLKDPDLILSGQKLRIPSATLPATDPQRAVEQASNAASAEAGKQ